MELPDDAEIGQEVGEQIATLWADPGIQAAFDNRSRFQLNDSAP